MPKKITVDASGNVISVEDVPEREVPVLTSPKRGKGKKSEGKTTRTYARTVRGVSTTPPAELIVCSMCNVSIAKGRMAKHLREAHLQETIERRKQEIKDINRDLKRLAPGFHRKMMADLVRKRTLLLDDLENLQRIGEQRHDLNA